MFRLLTNLKFLGQAGIILFNQLPAGPARKYSNEDLKAAIGEIKKGGKINNVAAHYNIPKATLYKKVQAGIDSRLSMGPPKAFTSAEEESLVKWIIVCSQRGHPRCGTDVRLAAKKILTAFPRPTRFKNNFPSRKWFSEFVKRHPVLKVRKPAPLSSASACVSEENLRNWWSQLNNYFVKNNLIDILNDGRRIANCDETEIEFNIKPNQVLVEKNVSNPYSVQSSGNKKGITFLHTILADGSYLKPYLIYPYKRMPTRVQERIPDKIDYNCNESGWMREENFKYYLEKVFYAEMKKKNIPFPVILFVDNHRSHISVEISKLAESLGIVLVSLYPNSTHLIQPLDCAIFRGLKSNWQNLLITKRFENNSFKVSFENIGELIVELLESCHSPEAVKSGFKVCGIYKWDVSNIDFTKIISTCDRTRSQKKDVVLDYNEINATNEEFNVYLDENSIPEEISIPKSDNSLTTGIVDFIPDNISDEIMRNISEPHSYDTFVDSRLQFNNSISYETTSNHDIVEPLLFFEPGSTFEISNSPIRLNESNIYSLKSITDEIDLTGPSSRDERTTTLEIDDYIDSETVFTLMNDEPQQKNQDVCENYESSANNSEHGPIVLANVMGDADLQPSKFLS
uniref:CSON012225 protein n=1 Tax=Culicoides sonorensis TaxID=179676 RepID=A0A336M977_CULSO